MMDRHPWLRHYPEEVKQQLEYPRALVTDFLKQTATQFPGRDAVNFLGKTLTYKELLTYARRFAAALIALGVKPGDRVALMLPNMPQYVICYYGVLWMGGIVVQTNPLYGSHDLRHHLTDCGAETIVCLDLVYPKVKTVRPLAALKNVIVTSICDFLPFPKNVLYSLAERRKGRHVSLDYRAEPVISLMTLLKQAAEAPREANANVDPEQDVAVLQYTGGTTGLAKGAMLTHRNLVANVIQCKEWMYRAETGKERMLAVVPLFHVYGMTACMNFGISIGATLLLIPKFEIDTLMKTIHREKPTLFPGAPTLYIAIIHHPRLSRYDLKSIRSCISGSAPLSIEVQQKFEELTGGTIVEGYGLSEASPVTHANPLWGNKVKGSIGIPWPDTEAKIVDEEGREVPVRQIGELVVKGPQVMKGYWNQPEETAAVLKDGWLYTGDLGYMDEEGYFYIVDRKKDVIIASGFNVYPREVEEVLYEHAAVQEAAVIGVADAYRGETVKAFIVKKQGAELTAAELDAFCRARLAAYKVPRVYEFRSELPKTAVGKILRRTLVEQEKRRADPP